MSLRINLKREEILELTNIYTKEVIKYKCQKSTPMSCEGCAFMNEDDICAVINCNGNYREDNTFINFIKVE